MKNSGKSGNSEMKRNNQKSDLGNPVPEGFTVGLATVDALPVMIFGMSAVLLGVKLKNAVFVIGAIVMLLSGIVKVLWKYIVALRKKNIRWMSVQLRIAMPLGLLLMLGAGVYEIVNRRKNGIGFSLSAISGVSKICFILGGIGMCMMTIFAFCLDSSKARSNWIEQITNLVAQALFLAGLLLL